MDELNQERPPVTIAVRRECPMRTEERHAPLAAVDRSPLYQSLAMSFSRQFLRSVLEELA